MIGLNTYMHVVVLLSRLVSIMHSLSRFVYIWSNIVTIEEKKIYQGV